MSGRVKKVRKQLEATKFSPEQEENIRRLEFLFSQFEAYPKNDISGPETLEGNIQLIESIVHFWFKRKSDFFQEHFIEELPGKARYYIDMEKVDRLSDQAQSLLTRFRRDLLPILQGSEIFDTANVMFKLGFLFARLDHDVAEADAVFQDRLVKQTANVSRAPKNARTRVWWAPHWLPLVEGYMSKNPSESNATKVAKQILPAINAKKKETQAPLTVENLARRIGRYIRQKSRQVGG